MSLETWKLERDLCRCCHAEGSFTSLAEPSHDLVQAEIFSEMLRHCLDIVIQPVEGTYNASAYTICEPCILRLRDASSFKQQVLLCEERFRDMYRNITALGDVNVEEEEQNIVKYEFKEELYETSEDDSFTADDGHDDAPPAQQPELETNASPAEQPELETNEDETDQVDPQKEVKGSEEMTSNVNLNKNTSTGITTREVNGKGMTNESYNLLKRNQTPDTLQNVFICNDCGKRFDNKRALAVHIASHEELKQGNNLKCKECAYQTETRDSLERHSKLHCFECDTCGYTAKKKHKLLNHLKLKHFHTLQSSNTCEARNNEISDLKEKENLCSVCGYKSKYKSDLKNHLRTHTGEKPFACSLCEYKCSQKTSLTRHLRIHTGQKPFACSKCDYKCTQKSSLTRHVRIHTGEKPYACSTCDYKCASKQYLKFHLLTHSAEKPYSCSRCEFKSIYKINLQNHLKTHTGEKSHSCPTEMHIRNHTGENKNLNSEKPYSCPFCEHKCSIKGNLKNHLRIHTGEKRYSCSLCKFECVNKTSLTKHLWSHSGGDDKRYSCSHCEYRSNQKCNLKRHLKIHTNKKIKHQRNT